MSGVHRPWRALVACLAISAVATVATAQARFFVSPDGDDAWSGTRATPDGQGNGPKRTLQGAQQAVRAVLTGGGAARGGVTVTVRPGRYSVLQPLTFGPADSGTARGRVTWRAERQGTVILDGGMRVTEWQTGQARAPLDKIDPSVRSFIVTANLTANGIQETGRIVHSAPNERLTPEHAELFLDDEPMRLAQWPNSGWAWIQGPGSGDGWDTPTARLNLTGLKTPFYDRNTNPGVGEDLWFQGTINYRLFNHFWERISRLDRATGDVRIAIENGRVHDGARRVAEEHGDRGRMRLTNSLWELDSPGEYYFDRTASTLYFYPPRPVATSEAVVSMTKGPILDLRNAQYITFLGFTVQNGRHHGVNVQDSERVSVTGFLIRNMGFMGVHVNGGRFVEVKSCRITGVGETGIHLEGGDRVRLVRAEHRAVNNHIYKTGRNQPAYRPGIDLWGMGCIARNNAVNDLDNIGIHFRGNDHVIERNEIWDVCKENADSGAIYAGWPDYTQGFGTRIRENYIYDVYRRIPAYHIIHGYYQDEMYSGVRTERNVFRNVDQPLQIGGGHFSIVNHNVFVDCVGGIRIDDRGLTQREEWMAWLLGQAERVPWNSSAWRRRYPSVFRLLGSTDIRTPRGNQFVGNVFLRSTTSSEKRIWEVLEIWGVNKDPRNLTLRNNTITVSDPFVAEQAGDFSPRRESGLSSKGFRAIRLRTVGVLRDSYINGNDIGHRRLVRP